MKNQIRGCVKISATGKNLYKFINSIHCGHIACFGQYCEKEVFHAEIYRHDLGKIRSIAEKYGIDLKSAECRTVSSVILKHKKRFGFAIGLIIVLIASLYFSSVVVTIEIQGNRRVTTASILSALAELDIKQGTPIRDIDFHYCENKLRLMIDDVSWASIRHTGNRIVVQVTEITEQPEMVRKRIPCNVVSSKDAEITYVSVYDGQLMHKIGDFVPQGTLLISGVAGNGKGSISIRHAMGKISGIYEETAEFEEKFRSETLTETGNSRNENYLKLFNLKIPLFLGKNTYDKFRCGESEKNLNVLGKKLPVGIIKKHISETELSETVFTEKELTDKIGSKIYLYEKNFIDGNVKIIDRSIKTEKSSDSIKYTVTYRLEGDICMQKDIFIK